jgi:branched-chain amino acid transport system permease protein
MSATLALIYIAAAEMWSFLAGHLGVISLGQQAFIGLGMYTLAILNEIYKWPLGISIIFSGLGGAIIAAFVSISFLRLRGFYFSLATMLVAEIFLNIFRNWAFTGAVTGMRLSIGYEIPISIIYYAACTLSVLSILAVYYIHNSKLGFAVRAIGCDEDAASEIGVNTFACKACCFIISGFVTALAGAIFTLQTMFIHPQSGFGFEWGIALVFISVIGGIGRIAGPIFGSVIYVALRSILSGYIGFSILLQGALCIVILTIAPQGVWGTILKYMQKRLKSLFPHWL